MIECSDASKCRLSYKWYHTPAFHGVTPANVCKGDLLQFHVNMKAAHYTDGTPADAMPFREIRLGGTLLDWEDTVE